MSEIINQTRIEDAVTAANAFMDAERGVGLDGDYTSYQVAERVMSAQERAEALLYSVPHPRLSGLYVPLSRHNATDYDEAAAILPGYMVLVPSALVEPNTSVFYPAVVSEDGLKTANLRLHVLHQPYHQRIGYGAATVLSAAGQSETKGVGEHGRRPGDGLEAEHFATLLAVGSDNRLRADWQAGRHVNHMWRQQSGDSVTTEVSKRLFGSEIPQSTVTINRQQIESGQAMLLWHEGLRDAQTGRPETATRDKALVIIQGLGYEALRAHSPQNLDNLKRLIA